MKKKKDNLLHKMRKKTYEILEKAIMVRLLDSIEYDEEIEKKGYLAQYSDIQYWKE